MGIFDKCGVRGDAMLCVVIFKYTNISCQLKIYQIDIYLLHNIFKDVCNTESDS